MSHRFCILLLIIAPITFQSQLASAEPSPTEILTRGTMAQAEKDLAQPADDNARFALGVAQFLRAVERVGGTLHKYGLRDDEAARALPFARLPVPQNPDPQPVGYDDVRAMLQTWLSDMDRVRQT